MITASPDRSSSIPHSLAPSADNISFGHLMMTATCGAICLIVSITASAMMKAIDGAGGSSGRRRTMVLAKRLPGGLSHTRPMRPRPPSCASARSQSPSGAPDGTRCIRSALVEPVSATSSKMDVRTTPLRLAQLQRRALELRGSPAVIQRLPMRRRSKSALGYRRRQCCLPVHQNT